MVLLVVPFRYRTGNDQWSTRIIDQYAVHLIDHGIMVLSLYHLLRRMDHIVPQVVKAKFVVRTISNITQVSPPAGFAVGPVFIDTVHRDAQPFAHGALPPRGTFRTSRAHPCPVCSLPRQ